MWPHHGNHHAADNKQSAGKNNLPSFARFAPHCADTYTREAVLPGMDAAIKYAQESVEKCRALSEFVQKRAAIEEEYATALRRLCKEVSLQPLIVNGHEGGSKLGSFFGKIFSGASSKSGSRRPSISQAPIANTSELLQKTSLWSTFYEIVDDTCQIAKSHMGLAELWRQSLISPMQTAIKDMEQTKRSIQDDASITLRNLTQAEAATRKHYATAQELAQRSQAAKADYESLLLRKSPPAALKEVDRAKRRKDEAEQKRSIAEQVWRQAQAAYHSLQEQFRTIDLPRIIQGLRVEESKRSEQVLHSLTILVKEGKRAAEDTVKWSEELQGRLEAVKLHDDERAFCVNFVAPNMPSSMNLHKAIHNNSPIPSYEQLAASLVQIE